MSDLKNIRHQLIGGWRMIDWKVIVDGKPEDYMPPLGLAKDCGGMLLYTENGLMSAMLSKINRPLFDDGSLDGGTDKERAAAFGTITSYTGRFEVDEEAGSVTHLVEYSTVPNFVGQRFMRLCIFNGDKLKLDTPQMLMGGELRASYIEWQRAI